MSKISRADSKARFRTGMYPTQADFENLHDSYVHKDDTIPLEQVGTNGATVVSLLNQKANSSHTHEIADVNGLQAFINQVNNFLGTVDASDETINRWKELEAFLQGITDTKNLLSLLQQYRQEILSAVEGQYLMQVPDLDAYTTAPDGKIVQYTGATTDKYKHGLIYERNGAGEVTIPKGSYRFNDVIVSMVDESFDRDAVEQYIQSPESFVFDGISEVPEINSEIWFIDNPEPRVGDRVVCYHTSAPYFDSISAVENGKIYLQSGRTPAGFQYQQVSSMMTRWAFRWKGNGKTIYTILVALMNPDDMAEGNRQDNVFLFVPSLDAVVYGICHYEKLAEPITVGTPASWQPCKSMYVID